MGPESIPFQLNHKTNVCVRRRNVINEPIWKSPQHTTRSAVVVLQVAMDWSFIEDGCAVSIWLGKTYCKTLDMSLVISFLLSVMRQIDL